MTALPSPRSEAPGWEFLISHHLPSRLNRTIAIRGRHRTYHLCARCTGQLLGLLAWVAVFVALDARSFSIFSDSVQWLFAVLPLPAAIDWITQATGNRESRNSTRLVSGMLLGAAFTDLLAALLFSHWTIVLVGLLVLLLYLVALMTALRLSGAWRRVIADHFPGITFD